MLFRSRDTDEPEKGAVYNAKTMACVGWGKLMKFLAFLYHPIYKYVETPLRNVKEGAKERIKNAFWTVVGKIGGLFKRNKED